MVGMSVFSYPILIVFLVLALALFILSIFINRISLVTNIIGTIFLILYLVNALLLGFNYLEIVITLLIESIAFIGTLIIKGVKK